MADQLNQILNFLVYFAVCLPILAFGLLIFMFTTPYPEFKLIRDGASEDPQKVSAAKAAASDLGGKILGLAIVVASAVYHSVSIVDLIIWGLIGTGFQVVVFYLFELLTPFSVRAEIPKGNEAVGIFSAIISITAGLILASLIS